MTKEGKIEYAHAVGIAAAHNPTEPWRIITAVTNDAARLGLCEGGQGFVQSRRTSANTLHCCRSLNRKIAECSGPCEHARPVDPNNSDVATPRSVTNDAGDIHIDVAEDDEGQQHPSQTAGAPVTVKVQSGKHSLQPITRHQHMLQPELSSRQ